MMRREIIWVLIIVLVFPCLVSARSLSVEKIVSSTHPKAGDSITIGLKFTNPFGKELHVKIEDKNLIGNNGLDIQCLEHTVPKNYQTELNYPSISLFSSGHFTLPPAKVTYINPDTGKEEKIESNPLEIDVMPGYKPNHAESITTIYKCNGVNIQSTSYSTFGSSFNIHIASSGITPSSQPIQTRIENNQLSQDINTIKREMERKIKREREFEKKILQNNEFLKAHKKLLNLGYTLSNVSLFPKTNDTGSFEFLYTKPNGSGMIKGKMISNEIQNLIVFTSEDKQRLLKIISTNRTFQKYNHYLISHHLNLTSVTFNISFNSINVSLLYTGNGRHGKIEIEYQNGTITNINMYSDVREFPFWTVSIFILILGAVFVILKKISRKSELVEKRVEKPQEKGRFDSEKEIKQLVMLSETLFKKGRKKDAYEKISLALRMYFSQKFGVEREITGRELLEIIRKKYNKKYSHVKEIIEVCEKVLFAKKQSNLREFTYILERTKKLLNI